jgi:2'-5' RNA ligase
MDTIRAFIAVPLPDSLLEQLTALQRQLKKRVPERSVRWVRPEGIHLTLKFLGDTPTEKLPKIERALAEVARHAPACTFTVGELGCFPNPRRPRIVWIGVQEPTGRLAALQDAIEEVMAPFGYEPEGRGFTPHLTLGRVQRKVSRSDAARVGEVVTSTEVGQLAEVPADRFALIRSLLKPTGAEYTALAEFPLHGGSG